ncbi:hypothetical protein GQR58_001764 [Nymphon striatum]|nr:hypothetical protein GQR58_001764 [Nymphon striatum]
MTRKWTHPTQWTALCSGHFQDDCYETTELEIFFGYRKKWKSDAVPTIKTSRRGEFLSSTFIHTKVKAWENPEETGVPKTREIKGIEENESLSLELEVHPAYNGENVGIQFTPEVKTKSKTHINFILHNISVYSLFIEAEICMVLHTCPNLQFLHNSLHTSLDLFHLHLSQTTRKDVDLIDNFSHNLDFFFSHFSEPLKLMVYEY